MTASINIPTKIGEFCGGAHWKYILCPSLPCNKDGRPFPLCVPTSRIARDILDFLWWRMIDKTDEFQKIDGSPIIPLILSNEAHLLIRKMYDIFDLATIECEYCGISHVEKGRCTSCGAPSKANGNFCAGGFLHIVRQMPRYDFSPALGWVEINEDSKSYHLSQYEIVCLASSNPEHRMSIMVSRCAALSDYGVACY